MLGVVSILVALYILARCSAMLDDKTLSGGTHFVAGITALASVLGIVALLYLTVGSI